MNQFRISQLWTWVAGAPLPFVLGAGGTVCCVPGREARTCCSLQSLCLAYSQPRYSCDRPPPSLCWSVSAWRGPLWPPCSESQCPPSPTPPTQLPFMGLFLPGTLFPRGFIAVWQVTYLIVLLIAIPFLSKWALGNMDGLQGLGHAYLVWEFCQVLLGLWVEREDVRFPALFPFQPLGSFSEEKYEFQGKWWAAHDCARPLCGVGCGRCPWSSCTGNLTHFVRTLPKSCFHPRDSGGRFKSPFQFGGVWRQNVQLTLFCQV